MYKLKMIPKMKLEEIIIRYSTATKSVFKIQCEFFYLLIDKTRPIKVFITPDKKYNRVVGIDYNLANKDNSWNGKFYVHKSFTANLDSKDYSAGTD